MSNPGRVASGTPVGRLLKASRINYVLEAAELAHQQPAAQPPRSGGFSGTVLVRNDSGEDRSRFDVLGITSVVIQPNQSDEAERSFLNAQILVGDTPDTDRDGTGRIAILQAPCKDGKIAPAVMSSLSVVRLDLQDSDKHTSAALIDGDASQLEPGGPIVVVWHDPGPGTKYGLVNLGAGESCGMKHEYSIDGNPTSGYHEYEYTLEKAGTEYIANVQVDWNETNTALQSKFLAAFPAVDTKDITVSGGPLPTVAIYATFSARLKVTWPVVDIDNTLNNTAAVKVRENGGG